MSAQILITRDLRSRFGPIRDQGSRPTCLAFAASDAHAGERPGWTPLSCEYAFFHAQRRAGRGPAQGALLASMLMTLEMDGQPSEEVWPYLKASPPEITTWLPPTIPSDLFRRLSNNAALNFSQICQVIDLGKASIILIKLSDSFFAADSDGVFELKSGEVPQSAIRHAMIAVGHGTLDGVPAILARNSWGSDWGLAGHVWLPKPFVELGLFGTALMEGEA